MEDIIDSQLTLEAASIDAETLQAPTSIRETLSVISVTYYGFDDLIHRGQIVMNRCHEKDINAFFSLARSLHFPIQSVIPISDTRFSWSDMLSCEANNSSGYNFRYITGNTDRLSKHAEGNAFDINPKQNIYLSYKADGTEAVRIPSDGIYDEKNPGTLTANHPLVHLMKERG